MYGQALSETTEWYREQVASVPGYTGDGGVFIRRFVPVVRNIDS